MVQCSELLQARTPHRQSLLQILEVAADNRPAEVGATRIVQNRLRTDVGLVEANDSTGWQCQFVDGGSCRWATASWRSGH
jgi:hypothetical protein